MENNSFTQLDEISETNPNVEPAKSIESISKLQKLKRWFFLRKTQQSRSNFYLIYHSILTLIAICYFVCFTSLGLALSALGPSLLYFCNTTNSSLTKVNLQSI